MLLQMLYEKILHISSIEESLVIYIHQYIFIEWYVLNFSH